MSATVRADEASFTTSTLGTEITSRVVDGVGADVAHQQGVAIGLGARHRLRADDACGARAVFHDDLLPQPGAQLVRDQPRGDVGGAAGRGRNDKGDRPFRPGGMGLACQGECHRAGSQPAMRVQHACLPT
ncbi:hypothetical protein G6F22_018329 [Rhizopus arrhizus]|nr:hypothetical protein G6F22_018329 [Rhizopus arrhizus]